MHLRVRAGLKVAIRCFELHLLRAAEGMQGGADKPYIFFSSRTFVAFCE